MTKTNFLMLFHEQKYIKDLRTVTMVSTLIYNSYTFPVLFSSFPCLSKSLGKDFQCKINVIHFKRAI